jgi:hypothetical protein
MVANLFTEAIVDPAAFFRSVPGLPAQPPERAWDASRTPRTSGATLEDAPRARYQSSAWSVITDSEARRHARCADVRRARRCKTPSIDAPLATAGRPHGIGRGTQGNSEWNSVCQLHGQLGGARCTVGIYTPVVLRAPRWLVVSCATRGERHNTEECEASRGPVTFLPNS